MTHGNLTQQPQPRESEPDLEPNYKIRNDKAQRNSLQ
jgi:hypothetical protein